MKPFQYILFFWGPFAFQEYGIKQNPEQVLSQTTLSWNQIFEQ